MSQRQTIRCPNCHCRDCRTTHTTPAVRMIAGQARHLTRRRKVCRHCGTVFYTLEVWETLPEEPAEDDDPWQTRLT